MNEAKDIIILAVESSCDETAAAVVKNGRTVLSSVISSQIDLHRLYGGVVPEIGVMDYGHLGINLLTESLQRARERILLAASYKFGIETFMHVCSVSDLDVIVTDNRLSRDYVEQLREMGVRVILVNPANHAVTLDTKLRA